MIHSKAGVVSLDYFPEIEKGIVFNQIPDLTASIWLRKKFFFEFSVLGNFENNYFLLGYQGDEDQVLQHIYFGNKEINIDPLPYLSLPDPGDSSLGVETKLKTRISTHEIMLRFDNNGQGEKNFIGQNEVTENYIPINGYILGRYFKLPDKGVNQLEVYLQDPDGIYTGNDGYKYRKADINDATLDSENGLVYLKMEFSGRVLVYYTKNGLDVGANSLGQDAIVDLDVNGQFDPDTKEDFNWNTTIDYLNGGPTMAAERQVTIGTKNCLLLWQPGVFSPFDIQSSYTLPADAPADLWRIQIDVVSNENTDNIISDPSLKFKILPEEGRFVAYKDEDLRENSHNLYPLYSFNGKTYTDLYGPYYESSEEQYNEQILVNILHPVSGYYLESNVLPGSVRVWRNGAPETRFTVDYETGEVTFNTPIYPTDRIRITYEVAGALLNNGDILFAWGNTINIKENLLLQLGTGFRWNFLPGAYSEEAYSRTGGLLATLSLQGDYEHVDFGIDTAFSFTHPDTTGIMRLLGMEEAGLTLSTDENLAYPSRPPDDVINGLLLTADNRGKLYYKDYREYKLGENYILRDLDWSPPSEQIYPYENGSKIGPYNVYEGESDNSLVMDFELTGSQWVGIQIPVMPGSGPIDLSSLRSIFMRYKAVDVSGNFDIHIQIGYLGEDIDADGRLDEESSTSSTGFTFNDPSNGVYLYVGDGPKQEGNYQLDSEDTDLNEFLDDDESSNDYIFKEDSPFIAITGNTGWDMTSYVFTSLDLEKLKRVKFVRIIITGSDCSGKLVIDEIGLAGTTFAHIDDSGIDSVTIQEIEEEASGINRPNNQLENTFSEIDDIFHEANEIQKVLVVEWNGYINTGDYWIIRGFTNTETEGAEYKKIVLYASLPTSTGSTENIYFSLLDADNKGITWNIPENELDANWKKMEVDLENKEVSLNGNHISSSSVNIDSDYFSLSQFKIEMGEIDSGKLYIDELHLTDPKPDFGGAVALDIGLSFPGDLVNFGRVTFLSDIDFHQKFQVISPGFSSLYGRPGGAWITHSLSEISFGFFFIYFELSLQFEGNNRDFNISGGHKIQIPKDNFPLRFTDNYYLKTKSHGFDFSRNNSIVIKITEKHQMDFQTNADSIAEVLAQDWSWQYMFKTPDPVLKLFFSMSKSVDDYSHQEKNYAESWIKGYRFIAPWNKGLDIQRTGKNIFEADSYTQPVSFGFTFNINFSTNEITQNTKTQTNNLIYDFTIPILLSEKHNMKLIPGYRRSGTFVKNQNYYGSLKEDIGLMWYYFSTQHYLYNQVPFTEIFLSRSEKEFKKKSQTMDKALYNPELTLEFSRKISSHIAGLFLPVVVQNDIGKSFEKDNDLYQFPITYHFQYQTNAVNLFGKYGAHSIFQFYNIDEFINTFDMTLEINDNGSLENGDFVLDNVLSFEGKKENTFTIQNTLHLVRGETHKTQDDITISFNWFIYPEKGIRFPLIKKEIQKQSHLSNIESFIFIIEKLKDESSFHPFNFVFRHETYIIFPEQGHFKAEACFGYDLEKIDNERIHRFVFLLGVELLLQF